MTERLDRLTREAIDAALASMQELADEANLHQTTLARWRIGTSGASPQAAAKLAAVLKRRALRLLELASELQAQAGHERRQR